MRARTRSRTCARRRGASCLASGGGPWRRTACSATSSTQERPRWARLMRVGWGEGALGGLGTRVYKAGYFITHMRVLDSKISSGHRAPLTPHLLLLSCPSRRTAGREAAAAPCAQERGRAVDGVGGRGGVEHPVRQHHRHGESTASRPQHDGWDCSNLAMRARVEGAQDVSSSDGLRGRGLACHLPVTLGCCLADACHPFPSAWRPFNSLSLSAF